MAYDEFWCWRPRERVITKEPLATDYRLSCKYCTTRRSLVAYTVYIYAIFVLITRKALNELTRGERDWAAMLIPSFLGSFFLVPLSIAIRNGRPKWMQIGSIFIGIASTILLIFLLIKAILQTITYLEKDKDDEKISELEEAKSDLGLTLICLAIYIPFMIWGLFITHSHYSYIRDRELWAEQREQAEGQPMKSRFDHSIT